MTRRRRLLWALAGIVFAWINTRFAYTGERDDSLCNTTRDMFRTDHPAGAAAFTLLLAAFWVHVVRRARTPGVQEIVVWFNRRGQVVAVTKEETA